MKNLSFIVFFFVIAACSKQEQDCSEQTLCTRTFYTYSTCTNGVYENVFENTYSSNPMSVCDTLEWIRVAYDAEKELYDASDVVFQNFIDLYPSNCNCSN